MMTETAAISRGSKASETPPYQRAAAEGLSQHIQLSDSVYRTVLGTEKRLRHHPAAYNIGELELGMKTDLDLTHYEQKTLPSLEDEQQQGTVKTGVPYLAKGIFRITDEGTFLQTSMLSIHLDPVSPHANYLLTKKLVGYEMVVPLVLDSIADGEAQARTGGRAAYLIPNPDWATKQRLIGIQGRAVIEGTVQDVNQQKKSRMVVQTTEGTNWLPGKRARIIFDDGRPTFNQGTKERPTPGEPVERLDKVRVPVEFVGRKMFVAGHASLVEFSPEHEVAYKKQRYDIEVGLRHLTDVVTNPDIKKITRLDGKVWEISDPEIRASAVRYLFAEMRQKEHLLTQQQHEQLWKLFYLMEPDVKPFIFASFGPFYQVDPRRKVLDDYFLHSTPEGEPPILSEGMTPAQIFERIMYMSAYDNSPPPFGMIAEMISDYEEQFDKNAGLTLLHQVVVSREEQLRGDNPLPAVVSLSEALPYMESTDRAFQTEWLAHFLYAGIGLVKKDPERWNDSVELYHVMQTCLSRIKSLVYSSEEDGYAINYEGLFILYPFSQYIKHWPVELPYGLGEEPFLADIIKHLKTVNETYKFIHNPISSVNDELLEEVAQGLRKL